MNIWIDKSISIYIESHICKIIYVYVQCNICTLHKLHRIVYIYVCMYMYVSVCNIMDVYVRYMILDRYELYDDHLHVQRQYCR